MAQQHPYCRTCGSQVSSKNVCNYCGCEPLKGHDYCCDCGTSTVAGAIMCVHCGASFQRKFPAALAVFISLALAIGVACAGYFIAQGGSEPSETRSDEMQKTAHNDSGNIKRMVHRKKDEPIKIMNNIPETLLENKDNAILKLIKVLPKNPKPAVEKDPAPISQVKNKPGPLPQERTMPSQVSMNVFSPREMRSYSPTCSYFEGPSKNNVVFFTTNVYGYIKINGKVFALQGVQKGNDIARFSGAGYEVTIEILGLAGSEKEWLADATIVIKDVRQRTLSQHKIYSTCTEF